MNFFKFFSGLTFLVLTAFAVNASANNVVTCTWSSGGQGGTEWRGCHVEGETNYVVEQIRTLVSGQPPTCVMNNVNPNYYITGTCFGTVTVYQITAVTSTATSSSGNYSSSASVASVSSNAGKIVACTWSSGAQGGTEWRGCHVEGETNYVVEQIRTLVSGQTPTCVMNNVSPNYYIEGTCFGAVTVYQRAVATPTITPSTGNYFGSVNVAAGNATAGATLRFTTNNTPVTASSGTVGGLFTITTNTTLRFKSFKTGMADSPEAVATFTMTPFQGNAEPSSNKEITSNNYDVYLGDVNGDGKSDYYFHGKQIIIILHGDIATPIVILPPPSFVIYGWNGGSYDSAKLSKMSSTQLSTKISANTLRKGVENSDYYIWSDGVSGQSKVLLRGATSADSSILLVSSASTSTPTIGRIFFASTSPNLSNRSLTIGFGDYNSDSRKDIDISGYTYLSNSSGTINSTSVVKTTAPTSITASLAGIRTVTWPLVANAVNYEVREMFNGSLTGVSKIVTGNNTNFGEFMQFGTYTYEVRACLVFNGAPNCSNWISSNAVTSLDPASAPHLDAPLNSATGEFTLKWNQVTGGGQYEVHENNQKISTTSALNFAFSGATTKTTGTYQYKVRNCTTVCGAFSNSVTVNVVIQNASSSTGSVGVLNQPAIDPVNDAMYEASYQGALMGGYSVGNDATFNYSLPITIPKGINGAQPNLRLSYNSNAKNGILGWGWSLSGMSAITRCGANMIRDGYSSGIQSHESYKYCLDGQRLVEVSAGEYRTESESFVRIKKQSDYWEVTDNAGTKSRYGFNIDSKLEDDQILTYAWFQDQQTDIASNSWSISYSKTSVSSIQTHYPLSISYTSNPLFSARHSIIFGYEDRDDISVKYRAGMRVRNDKRLSKIEIKTGTEVVSSYSLSYQQSGQTYHGKAYSDPAKTSRLASIKQCYKGSVTDCAAPVEFDWSSQHTSNYMFTKVPYISPDAVKWSGGLGTEYSLGQFETDTTTITHRYLNANGTESLVDQDIIPSYRWVDINNDGYTDQIKSFPTVRGVELFLGSATGKSTTASPTYSIPVSSTYFMAYLIYGQEMGSGTIQNDLNPQKNAYRFDYVDMNADGLLDMVRFPDPGCFGTLIWCHYNNVPAHPTVPQDISVAFNTGSGFSGFTTWYNQWGCTNAITSCAVLSRRPVFTDLNGDGLRDLFAFSAYPIPGALRNHMIGYNNGKGSNGGAFTSVQDPGSSWDNFALTGDFNGDGLMDIANLEKFNGVITVQMGEGKIRASNGDIKGFLPRADALNGFYFLNDCSKTAAATAKCRRAVKDFNNDGLDDIVEWGDGKDGMFAAQVYISLGVNAQGNVRFAEPIIFYNQDLLTSIANSNAPGSLMPPNSIVDWNLDGFYEFSQDYSSATHLYDAKNNLVANRIETVLEESRNVKATYEPLSSGLVYESLPTQPVDGVNNQLVVAEEMKGRRFGVAKLEVSDGIGGTITTEYKYKDAKTHGAGYGDLGFAEIEKIDRVTGKPALKTISTFYQQATSTYKLAGRLKQELTYTLNSDGSLGVLLSDTRNQWKVRVYSDDLDSTPKSPHYFAYLYQSSNQSTDIDGTLIANSLIQNRSDAESTCAALAAAPEIITVAAGAAGDSDYSSEGVLLYSQTAACDALASTAAVQIKAVENLDITAKTDARGLVQTRKQYAWVGSAISAAAKSFYQVRTQTFTYNDLGQLSGSIVEPTAALASNLKRTTGYVYNDYGSVDKVTESWDEASNDGLVANSRVTDIVETYDPLGVRKVVITSPLGLTDTTEFHPIWGLPTKQTDVKGLVTETEYDARGRATLVRYADGTQTNIYYRICENCFDLNSNARWYRQTKTTGSSASRVYYDGLGREVGGRHSDLNGLAVYSGQTYDSQGAVYKTIAPYYFGYTPKVTVTNHDSLGRVSSINFPDGSSETRSYSGLVHTTTNRLNQTQTRYLNAAGWVIKSVDNGGTPVNFTYWPFGDLKTTQISSNVTTLVSVTYDALGRKTTLTDPNTGTTTYTYNALSLIATQLDAKGQRTCYGYDALGRQTTRIDKATSTCTGVTQTWIYDTKPNGKGEVASLSGSNTDGNAYTEQYSYTAYGLPQTTTSTFGGTSYSVTKHYDAFNRTLGVTYPTGYIAANIYNTYGRLAQVQDSGNTTLWTANESDAAGNITQFTLGNGVVTNQTYDQNTQRIDTIRAVKDSLVIQDHDYQFDALGNLTAREDRKNTLTQSFCYDTLNRLKAARFNGCSSSINDFAYDTLGNLTAKEGIAGTLGYGTNGSNIAGPHAITSANGWAYQYDEIGNLKTATKTGQSTKTVQYSPFNTPTSITQGSKFSTLVYGPNENRITHSDSNGRFTKYVGGIYEEVTKGGVTQKIHYVGDFAMFIQTGGTTPTAKYEYLHRDHIGSIVATSKSTIASAADVNWQSNGAWGERRYQQWNGPLDDILVPASTAKGFTDHEHLDSVGLIHMNGRVYDPELGRFMSADPFVQAPYNSQSYNRYSYVFNNPLSYTDPSGYSCSSGTSVEVTDPLTGERYRTYDASDAYTLCGQEAYDYGQHWQNEVNRFQDTMANIGGFWPGVGYVGASVIDQMFVRDTLDSLKDLQEGDYKGAAINLGVVLIKPLKVADLAGDAIKNGKKLENALDAKTPHRVVSSGKAPDTAEPNSIYEVSRADGSKSITYYDEKGRAFSREDYGQQNPHAPHVGMGSDGRAVPHEHRWNYNDYGLDKSQSAVRLLDPNGIPMSDWF
ncbi:MAG: RHS repeat-associated core domain-containing protein [Pseudomonadota bacterium]